MFDPNRAQMHPSDDFHFHDLAFERHGSRMEIWREREVLAMFDRVRWAEVADRMTHLKQDMMLLRVVLCRTNILFFIDYDGIQTNLREVEYSLPDIEHVISWLLPSGHFARQGDVGIYATNLPLNVQEVPWDSHAEMLAPVLKWRHVIEHPQNCLFFQSERRFFLRVLKDTSLEHPEHERIFLPCREYEIKGARGVSYPILQNVRQSKEFPLVFGT